MSNTPVISVIIPVYNAEKTIRECVDSILSQDYSNFELILVDDGSIDESGHICDSYSEKDNRIRAFHKTNGGVSSARNLGLENAKGKWVTFVDSDDYVSEHFFDALNEVDDDLLIHPYTWKEKDVLTLDRRLSNYQIIDGSDNIRSFLNHFLTTLILRGPCAKFYKKDLISDNRFDERMKVGEDIVFVHHYLLKCSRIRCIHSSSYVVRISVSSADVKYGCDTDYAISSLAAIYNSFCSIKKQWQLDKRLFISYIVYFKMISKNDWKGKPSKWYRHPRIAHLYRYVWTDMSFEQRIKFRLIRFYSALCG